MGRWNGEPCEARRVIVRVAEAAKPTFWYAGLAGQQMRAVEVIYCGETFYIADEDGNGWHKVSVEGGGPHWGHKSLAITEVVRERTAEELDNRDCACDATPKHRSAIPTIPRRTTAIDDLLGRTKRRRVR